MTGQIIDIGQIQLNGKSSAVNPAAALIICSECILEGSSSISQIAVFVLQAIEFLFPYAILEQTKIQNDSWFDSITFRGSGRVNNYIRLNIASARALSAGFFFE